MKHWILMPLAAGGPSAADYPDLPPAEVVDRVLTAHPPVEAAAEGIRAAQVTVTN